MRLAALLATFAAALAACGGDDGGKVVSGTGYDVTVPDPT